jgi:hypothetical protein
MGHALSVTEKYLKVNPHKNWELAEEAIRSLDMEEKQTSQREVG